MVDFNKNQLKHKKEFIKIDEFMNLPQKRKNFTSFKSIVLSNRSKRDEI
jgi:hypothetical protein